MSVSNDKPLISVCVPAYNNADIIKNTIQSVIDQTYDNWELIISDDCSKDKTLEIIRTFKDPRIVIIENKTNLGMAKNFNKVVGAASGDFIKVLCGDDVIDAGCLEKQIEIFVSNKYPSVSLVISSRKLIDGQGKILMTRKFPFKNGFISSKKAMSLVFLFGTNIIGEPHVGLFRKKLFSVVGGFDDTNPYLVDLDFWFRVLLIGDLYVIPEPLASFRVSKSASSKMKKDQGKLFRSFLKKIYNDRRYKINIFQYYFGCFSSFIMTGLRHLFMRIYIKK